MSSTQIDKVDVVIVGAGIVGLANAWAAAKRGRSVVVLERSSYAQGASIRNFGMVWPIGQPAGERLDIAMRSRALWIEAAREAGFWHHQKGCIYMATHEDELAVMSEFCRSSNQLGYDCYMLNQEKVKQLCPAASPRYVIGGLASMTEVGVDPREAIAKLPAMLSERYGVKFYFDTAVVRCRPGVVQTSGHKRYEAGEQVMLCSGADIAMLYPTIYQRYEVTPCKLQMMATVPQPNGYDAGPMIASGASMRHYESFHQCAGLGAMSDRMDREHPEWRRYGVHFMAAHNALGEVVLGDSHEYGDDISPFDNEAIDEIILNGLRNYLQLPEFTIARRWHGIYLKTLNDWRLVKELEPGVTAFNGLGGAGMTMAFGLADRFWSSRARVYMTYPIDKQSRSDIDASG